MIEPLVYSVAMAVNGGWCKKWNRFPTWVGGNWFSALIVSAFINPLVGVFWLLGTAPRLNNMGGPDWKLDSQRGVFTGACLTFATGNIWFIPAGATMPWIYKFVLWRNGGMGWAGAEPVFGFVLGIAALLPLFLVRILGYL